MTIFHKKMFYLLKKRAFITITSPPFEGLIPFLPNIYNNWGRMGKILSS